MNLLAKKASGEILLIINDDIILDNGSIDVGLELLKSNSNIGIVSGNLRYRNGLIQHVGTSFNAENLSYHKFKKSLKYNSSLIDNTNLIISAATGALLMINKSLFNEIDERLAAGWYVHSGQRKRYLKSIIKDKKE